VLCVLVMSVLGIVFAVQSGDARWIFLSLPFSLVLFVLGRYAPTGYRLATGGVHIERRAGPRMIGYETVREVDRTPRRIAGTTVFGSRGVFGRFGRFWNSSLGFYTLFLTNTTAIVWLGTTEGWIALSPDRPDEFVERLRARLPPGGARA